MFSGILIPFVTTLLAEFLDKSQIAILLLSTHTRNRLTLFLGSIFAFIVVDGIAIFFGSFVTTLIPKSLLGIISGAFFLIFGVLALRVKNTEEKLEKKTKSVFLAAFLLVFLSEWGDKTQLSSLAFATQYPWRFVFIGTIAAMVILTLTAIIFGTRLTKHFKRQTLQKISGVVFLILGLLFLGSGVFETIQ